MNTIEYLQKISSRNTINVDEIKDMLQIEDADVQKLLTLLKKYDYIFVSSDGKRFQPSIKMKEFLESDNEFQGELFKEFSELSAKTIVPPAYLEIEFPRGYDPEKYQLWLDLKPKMIFHPGTETSIEFLLRGKSVVLEEKDLINCNKFRISYLVKFNICLPPLSNLLWSQFLTIWSLENREILVEEELSDVDTICSDILNEISTSQPTTDLAKTKKGGFYVRKDNSILIPNERIENILKKHRSNITPKKVSMALKQNGWINKPVDTQRVNKEFVRFWCFDEKKFAAMFPHMFFKKELDGDEYDDR